MTEMRIQREGRTFLHLTENVDFKLLQHEEFILLNRPNALGVRSLLMLSITVVHNKN